VQNVDLGGTMYLELPYSGGWLLAAARVTVEKRHLTLTELIECLAEVCKRHPAALQGAPSPTLSRAHSGINRALRASM
jgi:hypothetical protein